MAHTPTPWRHGPHYRGDVESSEGRVCECTPFNSERAADNAAFIVRAVNCHAELLAALKRMDDAAVRLGLTRGDGSDEEKWVDALKEQFAAISEARVAIAKAEAK